MTMNSVGRAATRIQISPRDRRAILNNVLAALQKRLCSPEKLNANWEAAVERCRPMIENANTADDFEQSMSDPLAELRTSHVDFFHSSARRASSRAEIRNWLVWGRMHVKYHQV
jgi:carboxyl-terminal processing protease